jgi:CSLREA domain-containing protein
MSALSVKEITMRIPAARRLALILFALALALPAAPAQANHTPFTVTSTVDDVDDNPGDGTCASPSGGPAAGMCTLRAAVMEANAHAGDDTINLPAGVFILNRLVDSDTFCADDGQGDLDITSSLTIDGAGLDDTGPTSTVIQGITAGGTRDRIIEVSGGPTVTLSDLKVNDGSGGFCSGLGGNIASESSTLTLQRVRVSSGDAGTGAGVYVNGGSLTVSDGQLIANSGVIGLGIASVGSATVTVTRTTFQQNQPFPFSCTQPDPIPGASGGGISSNGTLTVTDSAFLLNGFPSPCTIEFYGGAIGMSGGSTSLTNVTISGNDATWGGGGVGVAGGTLSTTNVTIADNRADSDGDVSGVGGGITDGLDCEGPCGGITIKNTILANNVHGSGAGTAGDCYAAVAKQEVNLVETPEGGSCGVGPGVIVGQDPQLEPGPPGFPTSPSYNGGPTPTRALLPSSPAIDAGTGCPPPGTDQRGTSRPADGPDANATATCDLGAYEFVDSDGDTVPEEDDNCPGVANPGQADFDGDGQGDVCGDPAPKQVELSGPKKVLKGKKARLTAEVTPCPGHAGHEVKFLKGATVVATVVTDATCTAMTKVRMKRKATFQAISPQQDADHQEGVSNLHTVKVRKPRG